MTEAWAEVLRLALALVFLLAAVTKLRRPHAVKAAVAIVAPRAPGWAWKLIAPGEVAVVAVLLVTPAVGAAVALLLLIGFGGIPLRHRADHVPCACLGSDGVALGMWTVARNAVLGAGAVVVIAENPATTVAEPPLALAAGMLAMTVVVLDATAGALERAG